MSALSNIQLKCMITCDPLMKDKIIGVYSADQIKTLDVQKGLHPVTRENTGLPFTIMEVV